ncbi:hypothetical protein PLEOSDRAFT_1108130 [Pleurotus ostreatus PC15]|uniref:Uncharacterized protein n=1 Tax=Pleurotus ostreatus (strain PC15) TaxID=1137138 RepID=A0A067N6I3_PLEO1|nr:hypothetical protein PLEOSDRAFT_1108130 [Pleurotus ostreatus PC15]
MRFQVALDALLPLLESSSSSAGQFPSNELAQRILAAYILYSLYAPYPISINPFKTALFATFVKERRSSIVDASTTGPNEQLVWVLWKILKGDGNDIAPYSPSTLARSPLPPKLRAAHLMLSEDELSDASPVSRSLVQPDLTNEPQSHKESLVRAMSLLLAARERVLTLSEQKVLNPLLPALLSAPADNLTNSHNDTDTRATNGGGIFLTSLDIAPIVYNNLNIAYSIIVSLLSDPPPSRVAVSDAPFSPSTSTNEAGLPLGEASIGEMLANFGTQPTRDVDLSRTRFLDVLVTLPPTFPSFDLMGRLLRDPTVIPSPSPGPGIHSDSNGPVPKTTVADLIRNDYLGPFVHSCIEYLDEAEREEREEGSSEDKWAVGVRHLCRFYHSLIKLSLVDPTSDADSAEMAHFSLRNAKFEEAMALYKVFANANSDRMAYPTPGGF